MGVEPRRLLMALATVIGITGCGGGGSGGEPTSAAPLSADQQVYQQVELNGGESTLGWQFPFGGGTLVSGTDYIYANTTSLKASPATGPQTQAPVLTSLSSSLTIPSSAPTLTRVLVAGQVLLAPATANQSMSFSGTGIRRDRYAQDGVTLVDSALFSNYSSTPLSGNMADSPGELLAWLPIGNWLNTNTFTAGINWLPGSAYLKSQGRRIGDTVFASDCVGSTTTAEVNPCAVGMTLDSFFPYVFASQSNDHPIEADFAADGAISTIQGVRMWVATAPLPQELENTPLYRVFYELNGNIYTGTLEKDGTSFYYQQASGNVVGYQITLNQAALNSIIAGLVTDGAPGVDRGSSAAVPSVDLFGLGGHGVNGAIAPVDLRQHYNIPSTLDGAGQTIAIVDAPGIGDTADDLNTFSAYYGLPQCNAGNPCFQQIDLSGGAAGNEDWGNETALDTQMAHAIAPAAKIVLVIANSDSLADLMAAVQAAAAVPGVTAVSMSFSRPETADEQTRYDPIFTQHPGVVFFGCTGDWASYAQPPKIYTFGSAYPASSPYVTAVGGTRLQSIAWTSSSAEIAWQFSSGGPSNFEPMPAWQSAYLAGSPVLGLNNGMRAIPDVAALADFEHSAWAVFHRLAWHMDGGCSTATPLWAGFAALLAQQLANNGQSLPTLIQNTEGGFNGLLYQTKLMQGQSPSFYAIPSGSNNLTSSPCALCTAGPGYNDVTGLGSPNFTELLSQF